MDVYKNPKITSVIPSMKTTASNKKILDCSIKKFDLMITPSSETRDDNVRTAVVIDELENVVYSYHLMRFRLFNPNYFVASYLHYLFNSAKYRKTFYKLSQGSQRFVISKRDLENLEIELPSDEEIKRIVQILDTFTQFSAELKAELKARVLQYDYYRDLLLSKKSLFNEYKLKDVVKSISIGLNPRNNFKLNEDDSNNFYVTTKDINDGKIIFNEKTDKISDYAKKIINKRSKLEKGDILFSGIGTIGKIAIVNEDPNNWDISESLYSIKPNTEIILGKYLKYVLETSKIKNIYKNLLQGSTLQGLRKIDLENIKLIIPSLQLQEKIAYVLDNFEMLCQDLNIGLPAELELRNKQYEYYRDKLLSFAEGTLSLDLERERESIY
ncbi:restriction endonuclease subunit S [Mycoplasmopsis columbina]|uniref:restriction endonuclease subunit S n=1 Tax=Mycoplasmopsis columbina TaxID=114881 RepID=UPI001004EE6F|nr:restriction endonuclease subunit S [Mycoplasmopsis columbina]VEU77202.1 Type I restriction enzyme specificity protein [Mycoplasmopsis columbina]